MHKVAVLDKRGEINMRKSDTITEIVKVRKWLAKEYNRLPNDKFTRNKIAIAIDILMELENNLKSSDKL